MSFAYCGVVRSSTTVGLVLTLVSGVSAASHAQDVIRALPTHVIAPADNPTTPEKIALGRLLFWDPILSGHKDVACATCHHPDFGYAENLDVSIGVNGTGLGANRTFATGTLAHFVKRNSQTVLNTAFNGIGVTGHYAPVAAPMFWDRCCAACSDSGVSRTIRPRVRIERRGYRSQPRTRAGGV